MARVEIHLEDGETEEEVQELLIKAFQHHALGAEHKQAFHEPAARAVADKLVSSHEQMWTKILKEISEVLNEDI